MASTAGPATADPSVRSKREQAQAVMDQVQQLDSSLSHAIEAYDYANVRLGELDRELESNARQLKVAKKSLAIAQVRIAERLRALYIHGEGDSTIEVLLGAESLDDLLTRLDAIERVAEQDTTVLREVKARRAEIKQRRARLRDARAEQARIVGERASRKQAIESQLGERQRLLASIKDQIAELEAAEQRRQAALQAEARARLEAAQAAASVASASDVASARTAYDEGLDEAASGSGPPVRYAQVVGIAMQYLGVPYVWGGMSPAGFDCSGFVAYVYAQIGVSLPHHAASQYGYGSPVSRDQLAPGDLVFFDGLGHMGIYIGSGQFIHSPHTGDVVKISSLYDSWYSATYVGARRL
jgi:peptidoglycan DL-endopeptidase CwlO